MPEQPVRSTLESDDAFRQRVLRTVEDATLASTGGIHERLVALDRHGQEVFSKIGERDQVTLSLDEVVRMAGVTDLLTHNHDDSTAFSPNDVAVAALLNVRELNAFGERVRWRLIRRGALWPRFAVLEPAFRRADRAVKREVFQASPRFAGGHWLWSARDAAVWQRLADAHPTWFTFLREDRDP